MAKKPKKPFVDVHVKLPTELAEQLDREVARRSEGSVYPKPNRSDLIRDVLLEASKSWGKP